MRKLSYATELKHPDTCERVDVDVVCEIEGNLVTDVFCTYYLDDGETEERRGWPKESLPYHELLEDIRFHAQG